MKYIYKCLRLCFSLVLCTVCWSHFVCAQVLVDEPLVSKRKATSAELTYDDDFKPALGISYYDVFLRGAKLGRATIEVSQKDDNYVVAVTARTRGVMKYLYRVKYRGEVDIKSDPLQPVRAVIEERTGNKRKTIHAEFLKPDKITTVEEETENGGSKVKKVKEFDSETFILDPFSTVFLIRSLDWEIGTDEIFDVFTGNKQYELHLACTGESVLTVGGKSRLAWEIIPQTRTLEKPQKIRMSGFVIYLSQDEHKEVLKITGDPKIGRIVANLRKFTEIKE
ncbi:MAG: hypothetical protein ACI8ZB_001226 [Desulforhopalus sp.]|jgi:hypothetical protein